MRSLLVLNLNPSLEDDLVDYLLGLDEVEGFTSFPVRGHGRHGEAMSTAEQVSGRRKRVQFELLLDEAAVETVLAGLRDAVGTDLYWWCQPVSASGHLD